MKYDIPAYAEEISQQKIYPVIDFPKKPKNLRAFTQTARPLIYKKPSRAPKKAIFLFGVQWYWSPHSKNDNYFISWTRKHWFCGTRLQLLIPHREFIGILLAIVIMRETI